jgi:3',5'-cyclic AMP phosphodiesterase CpdA
MNLSHFLLPLRRLPLSRRADRSESAAITDPRSGDVEDDASSSKSRSLIALAGSLLVEISWMKLAVAWLLLLVLPGLVLGAAPIAVVAWVTSVGERVQAPLVGLWSLIALGSLLAIGWYGGRTLLRLGENSFWALNSAVVEPTYAVVRETLRHVGDELLLPKDATQAQHGSMRAAMAAMAGLLVCALALSVAVLAWHHSFWAATLLDLISMRRMALAAVANSIVLVAGYVAAVALFWGVADATLPPPRDLDVGVASGSEGLRRWRIAHLSDLHTVGERYGFRIECGRAGARGNERIAAALFQLAAIHARDPLDAILITGDLTDAGRSSEWAELVDALAPYPELAARILIVPGNHDLNVVDRGNPGRVDLPTSPKRRLRQVRTLSMACAIQGTRVHIIDRNRRAVGPTLAEMLRPHAPRIRRFSDTGRPLMSRWWLDIWSQAFPMIVPPDGNDGLGFILINSNAATHFSFTNALGMVSSEQLEDIEIATQQYPRACWVIALHHHVVEYPWRPEALAERIGTTLINGNWFVRRLRTLAGRAVVMHGHRHVDWLGECAGLPIVSAPSQVMNAPPSCFHIHTLVRNAAGGIGFLAVERIVEEDRANAALDRENRVQV